MWWAPTAGTQKNISKRFKSKEKTLSCKLEEERGAVLWSKMNLLKSVIFLILFMQLSKINFARVKAYFTCKKKLYCFLTLVG